MAFDVRRASRNDDLRELWRVCFNEDWGAFEREYDPDRAFVAAEDGKNPVSTLHFIPQTINLPHQEISAAYILGVATLPEYRGRGLAGALVEKALDGLCLRGVALAFLIPASAGLARFYARFGFAQTGLMPAQASPPEGGGRVLDGVTPEDAKALDALYGRMCADTAHPRRDAARWDIIARSYTLKLYEDRYQALDARRVLEDSAGGLVRSDTGACVKFLGAAEKMFAPGLPMYANLLYN
ncbi:MAG: GNAT family N-acetyltransferase [Oscillospiraceae bacterium]|jgi:ribosomal protein S18 acetylase RimI-like enzyme|nr:GNAT family N-acetyltransferase [Oscillospiraceae bacterium]